MFRSLTQVTITEETIPVLAQFDLLVARRAQLLNRHVFVAMDAFPVIPVSSPFDKALVFGVTSR